MTFRIVGILLCFGVILACVFRQLESKNLFSFIEEKTVENVALVEDSFTSLTPDEIKVVGCLESQLGPNGAAVPRLMDRGAGSISRKGTAVWIVQNYKECEK